MSEILTAAQMRAIEQAAIESGEVTGLELMERAGKGVVEAIFEEWPELANGSHGAVVLCGPGNNGGDGFVVARLLKERGWQVEVFLYGDAQKLPPDAKVNYERWEASGGGTQIVVASDEAFPSTFPLHYEPSLVIDAIFGTGLTRKLSDQLQQALNNLNSVFPSQAKWIAVDIPSGLCADSGKLLGGGDDCFWLDRFSLTVTFHQRKLGHFVANGPAATGGVVCKGIGLSRDILILMSQGNSPQKVPSYREKVHLTDETFQITKGEEDAHKYTHGHALILSGGPGKTGAARLAARGALRIGAGLVTLGVPPSAQMEVASQITALMLRRVDGSEGLESALEDARFNALCLGPGLGQERARELVPVAVRAKRAPYVVLDADALSAFADDPAQLFDLLHARCVLTPHEGEFRRLFPDLHAKLVEVPTKGPAYSKVDATREAAKRAGCTVLFKGPDTVIADPTGQCSINSAHYERSAPWLATAGSGDVLAGFITGLLARGFSPMQAAETAAYLHVECALEFGPGLIAEDLPEQLPAVFRKLEL
ncbi:NAD(P)H-hydrate dehydratase [Shimia sp. W99]